MANVVPLTPARLSGLREAHAQAKGEQRSQFEYEGVPFCTSYAGYLLAFIDEIVGDMGETKICLKCDSPPFENQPSIIIGECEHCSGDDEEAQDCFVPEG